jgi:spore coat polysaccharide biosynthesis protein SpsF (cytidylyltransferase family)
MNKNIKEICFIVQARLNSQRIPNKMIKPFGNSNLFDILLKKLTSNQSIIPRSQLYVSVYENELKNIAKNYNVNIFNRS